MTVEKKITLDFGGFTLSSVGGVYQSGNDCIFNVASTGSLTLIDAQISTGQYQYSSSTGKGDFIGENNGTVTVESTKGFHIQAGNFIYENYGDVVVKDGWFQLSSCFIGDSYGTVKIFSGNFKNEGCCFDTIYDTVEVFSGHFETESYCFDDVYGNLIIHDGDAANPADWQETQSSSIRFYDVKYKVCFYAEEKLVDEQEKPRKDLVFVCFRGERQLYCSDGKHSRSGR